ncbi:hypothetical protein B7P43_G07673 [Cryptotermes secundus]|uniref:DDE-1 domain-containing protein n=1 Tax=Cryptotermes secundus TaxID=105785 RepID=A0A2J7RJP1_9NEOP|nr:hypothetical protein B7P43_G07673 [Cryptotermes secundus]
MEAIRSSETSVNTTYTRCQIPEDCFLHSHRRGNLKPYKINVVFMPANTTPILQPMDQGVISIFKSLLFKKHISDTSDESRQSKLKTFWKGITILDPIKNIRDSWEEVKISTVTGVWKKLIPTLMDDFVGFKQHRMLQRNLS